MRPAESLVDSLCRSAAYYEKDGCKAFQEVDLYTGVDGIARDEGRDTLRVYAEACQILRKSGWQRMRIAGQECWATMEI